MTFRINEAKVRTTSADTVLLQVSRELKRRIKVCKKQGVTFTENQMIDGFREQYKGIYAQACKKVGVSLNDLIDS